MRVTQGWSGEVEANRWAKVSVELDETDLLRLINEADGHSTYVDETPTAAVFKLLDGEAERLVLYKLMTAHGYPAEKGTARIREILTQRAELVAQHWSRP
jgi:hypothetical protein